MDQQQAFEQVTVVGGGLAGSECALSLAARGVPVKLIEMRPVRTSPAHKTGDLAELVCSNSLKSTRVDSAAGLLKAELDLMGSKLLPLAKASAVPAGGALAVDREAFAQAVTQAIEESPLIELVRQEVTEIPQGPVVIAAGPLCSEALFASVQALLAESGAAEALSFFDAAAPIVDRKSVV